jgi:hypothetical protein
MLVHTRELDKRRMLVAVGFGVLAAWLMPPIAVAGLRQSFGWAWLPSDGSVEGLLGLLVGLGSINLVGAWLRFVRDPKAALKGGQDVG